MYYKSCRTPDYQRRAVAAYYERNKEKIKERKRLQKEIKKLEEEMKKLEILENEYNELNEN